MRRAAAMLLCALPSSPAFLRRQAPAGSECIVPSKPGGAMDLTCKLVKRRPAGNCPTRRDGRCA
jgi:putative tricarboxylic transport membrane protein